MQYLVMAEWVELGALLSPGQVSGIIDQTVGPSLEILAQWEEEGKIRGGIVPGERPGLGFSRPTLARNSMAC